jgi:thioredoxin reductase (NADPH)
MTQSDLYDLVIIGGGPGGISAGIYAMRAALKTTLVEKGVPGGQVIVTGEVENYPGFKRIGGAELSMKLADHVQSYGIEMITQEVEALNPGLEYHSVHLADGRVLRSYAVILATGGTPRKLNIPGEDTYYGKGVSYCATCDGFFFRDKTVVVVGGGDTAAEEALYLARLCDKVYIAHRRDALRASAILKERIRNECKIEILWNTIVTEIKASQNEVNEVVLQDTRNGRIRLLAVDGVFVFIGFTPNNQLVPAGTRMNVDGLVITDGKCATDTPGIYVIGDLREKYGRQIVLSAADGCTAALAAAHFVEAKKSIQEKTVCATSPSPLRD